MKVPPITFANFTDYIQFSTHLSGLRLASSYVVDAHFTGFAAYSIFYLRSSKIVIFQENGVEGLKKSDCEYVRDRI